MTYEVEWLESARRELLSIWTRASKQTRSTLTGCVERINDRLAIAPYSQGESRPPTTRRIFFELPLRVSYRIERFHGAVTILHVYLIRKRSN